MNHCRIQSDELIKFLSSCFSCILSINDSVMTAQIILRHGEDRINYPCVSVITVSLYGTVLQHEVLKKIHKTS